MKDHPIFLESIRFIRTKLKENNFNNLENSILERLIHSSGDFEIAKYLEFSENAALNGLEAIKNGAPILTDTDMTAVAIKSMASKAHGNVVFSAKNWINENAINAPTKTAYGMERAWNELSSRYQGRSSPIVAFGSSPTALEKLLDILGKTDIKPSLIVGMPVGFIGVLQSKARLLQSIYPYIILNSTRGGSALAAATINALLRYSI